MKFWGWSRSRYRLRLNCSVSNLENCCSNAKEVSTSGPGQPPGVWIDSSRWPNQQNSLPFLARSCESSNRSCPPLVFAKLFAGRRSKFFVGPPVANTVPKFCVVFENYWGHFDRNSCPNDQSRRDGHSPSTQTQVLLSYHSLYWFWVWFTGWKCLGLHLESELCPALWSYRPKGRFSPSPPSTAD